MQLIVKYMIKSFNLFFKRTFLKKKNKQTNFPKFFGLFYSC